MRKWFWIAGAAAILVAVGFVRLPNPSPLPPGAQKPPSLTVSTFPTLRGAQPYFGFPLPMPPWPPGTNPAYLTIAVAGDGIDNPAPPPTQAVLTLTIDDKTWGPVQLKEEAGTTPTVGDILRNAFYKYRPMRVKDFRLWTAVNDPYAVTVLATTHDVVFRLFINDAPSRALQTWADALMVGVLTRQAG